MNNEPAEQPPSQHSLSLEPDNARNLAALCGQFDAHIKQIEKHLGIRVNARGNQFLLTGPEPQVRKGAELLEFLYRQVSEGRNLDPESLHIHLQEYDAEAEARRDYSLLDANQLIKTRRASIKPRGRHQQEYVRAIRSNDISFGIGPAGTGKTYLAVACAVEALLEERVRRILLVRPAVEAGEKLGFLPGDLAQKIDPYLRPLYDALYEMLGFDTVHKYIERNIIEVAPLAFMRGRTLNNSFIILDEAQNTTREQMKMFLTRIGFGSRAVVTGDATQIDLPRGAQSGLTHVSHVLAEVAGLNFTYFANSDVVRHPLIQRIVAAYDSHDVRTHHIEKSQG